MNPKNLNVRMDRETGEFWLTEERYRKPIRKVVNITDKVLLSLCADLFAEPDTKAVTRDVKFSDGGTVRLTVEDLGTEQTTA